MTVRYKSSIRTRRFVRQALQVSGRRPLNGPPDSGPHGMSIASGHIRGVALHKGLYGSVTGAARCCASWRA